MKIEVQQKEEDKQSIQRLSSNDQVYKNETYTVIQMNAK